MRTLLALLLMPAAWSAPVHVNGRIELDAGGAAAVEFKSPQGEAIKVSPFWDGGDRWRVRFSPPSAGRWKYTAGKRKGTIQVTAYKGSNPLYRHGRIGLSKDRRYFAQADGTPWFFLSDTGWNAALKSTHDEWRQYIADRAAKKFTAIQFVMTQWRAGREDEKGQTAYKLEGGKLALNPAFFARLDEKFDTLNDQGLAAAPVMLWALASKDRESPGISLSTEQAIELGRYMNARYQAHHVLWILGGDGNYSGPNAERWKSIGRGIFPAGSPHAPVTLHPGGMRDPWPEYVAEPWVEFFMLQSGHGSNAAKWKWNATQGVTVDWKLEPPRPVIDGEPNYEGHISYQGRKPITDADVRRAVYYSLLAGPTAGVTYGAHGIWFWSRKAEVPLDHPSSGVALPWDQCLNYPGAQQMRVMRDIFDSMEWWKLRPDRTLLAEDVVDEGFTNYVMASRSEDGKFALLYAPANASLSINAGKFQHAAWIDPKTGLRTNVAIAAKLSTPGPGDWLLLCW
jgi:hypothetical protein